MGNAPIIIKPELQQLPQMRDRLSFLYLERCIISRKDGAITVRDQRGIAHIPVAMLGVVMLGPGTNVTHRAIELLGDAGASIVWVGERGVRYYAHGRPLTHSSKLLCAQARKVSNTHEHLAVARKMYQLRFPGEDVTKLTMQQLRGREGARIRAAYRQAAKDTGIRWHGREYNPDDFSESNPINMALSAAHACLYGIAHSVIVALGCSPGLGFVHTGNERSFVYDIADLYKAELTIPIAFEVTSKNPEDVGSSVRLAVRNAVSNGQIMERMVADIRELILEADDLFDEPSISVLNLWDEKSEMVPSGVSYRAYEDSPDIDDLLPLDEI